MGRGSSIYEGPLAELRRDNPWPELPKGLKPFYVALDSGGRHLVTDIIQGRPVSLMIEIGCFLCGSTRQWLEARNELTVIGIDPWDSNWANHILRNAAAGRPSTKTLADPRATADVLLTHGNFVVALNNVRLWRDRFIPVRQRSPEALRYLRRRQIRPELIFIDAFKQEDDLRAAYELFPNAVLCGDDWDWRDESGELAMQKTVQRFALEHGFDIEAERATWVLTRAKQRSNTLPPPARSGAADSRECYPRNAIRRHIGARILSRFAAVAGRPDLTGMHVLHVDCGGAIQAAVHHVPPVGRYVGVSAEPIDELKHAVDGDRFEFHELDVQAMAVEGADFTDGLPIGNQTFDLIIATSIFDHLNPAGARTLLGALRQYARPHARLAYTLIVDELTAGGYGIMDAYARELGASAAATTARFQDFVPGEPLRIALYERQFAQELLEGTGWALLAIEDPAPPFQHLIVAEAVPQGDASD
jgi:hypothetical protein